jgi:hypothetical protein
VINHNAYMTPNANQRPALTIYANLAIVRTETNAMGLSAQVMDNAYQVVAYLASALNAVI